jgi:predicted Zn-dependent protease
MGQYDEALALAQEAKKLAPENFSVSVAIGEALLGKGDTAEGIRELEHAREMAPENVRIRWDLVRAYSSAGRNDDAAREKQEIEKLTQSTTPDGPKQ